MGGKVRRPTSPVIIWHNPRCSKSRQTLELLGDRGIVPTVRNYLDDPPSRGELGSVLQMLAMEPRQLMRQKEAVYADLGLDGVDKSRADLISAMADHPILIERPLVIRAGRAALGRPPRAVLEIL